MEDKYSAANFLFAHTENARGCLWHKDRNTMKRALVCGAGGFIGSHLVARLKLEGYWVRGVDLKEPEYDQSEADQFLKADLRNAAMCSEICDMPFSEVYQLADDAGGAGHIFTKQHDADIMHNSVIVNCNMLKSAVNSGVGKIFFSSSACIYPEQNPFAPLNPSGAEDSAYPSLPDSEYGWEKLFSERLYLSYQRNYEIRVRIARLHNVFGPGVSWNNGRENALAALCRKVAESPAGGEIEVWGNGSQTRSFLYIEECLEGVRRLMDSEFSDPLNIGSEEIISIDQLAYAIMRIAKKDLRIRHAPGPVGVAGRKPDNRRIREKLGWSPDLPLSYGLEKTYAWIREQVVSDKRNALVFEKERESAKIRRKLADENASVL